jgi:putative ABC transport system substrate-binding protein
MKRREFIAGLGSAVAWPVVARAQASVPVIGFLNSVGFINNDFPNQDTGLRYFRQGLSEMGYVEGRNVAIEYRWAENQYDRLPALAADLVSRHVAVIVAGGTPATLAAKAATTTIPIVFVGGGDPVALGFVASLNRPGANLTGSAVLEAEITPKRLQLLRELKPDDAVFGVLADPSFPSTPSIIADLQAAARTLGRQLVIVNAGTDSDLETAFTVFSQQRVGAILVGISPLYPRRTEQLAALAARHALPAIFPYREFVLAGGLISYGGSLNESWRIVGGYAGRILRGDKPADLPVQQITKIELAINLKTAKALGLAIPQSILLRADEVIE